MSAQMLEVSLLEVGTVLRLEKDAWSMVKRLRQATNEYALPPPGGDDFRSGVCHKTRDTRTTNNGGFGTTSSRSFLRPMACLLYTSDAADE